VIKQTIFILLLFASQILFAQKIENVNFKQKNDTVFEINYDLSGTKPEQLFIVRLHYTTDGWKHYSDSLKFVSGDVGKGITGGKGKTIIWEAFKETKKLNEKKIKFDVKARIVNSKVISNKNKTGTFKDTRDGKVYKTVTIGTQTWMAENLSYKKDSGCWAYENKQSNVAIYGYLYNWETAKKVCPSGWHLPSDAEWTILTTYLGGKSAGGGKLKSTIGWNNPNSGATNESGFTALPGGCRNDNGLFVEKGKFGSWWSSTGLNSTYARCLNLGYDNSSVNRFYYNKAFGFSVRCLRNF